MDLINNIPLVQLLAAQSINDTDTFSNILDTRGFERAMLAVVIGDCTGLDADSKLELFLQEGDTPVGADFAPVPVSNMIRDTAGLSSLTADGLFKTLDSATEDQIIAVVEYTGKKRYLRVKLDFTTGTGGITAAPVCVVGLLGGARHAPATAPAPVTAA
jgi:hypothetical protein